MNDNCEALIAHALKASAVTRGETLQPLWSGFGQIYRAHLTGATVPSVIVKHINPEQHHGEHPRGWHSEQATQRKLKSYRVEQAWYKHYSAQCTDQCKVPVCYASDRRGHEQWLILEDLDHAGYPLRFSRLSPEDCRPCLRWLAQFHSRFLQTSPDKLWTIGSYWHLATRQQEWLACKDPELRKHAQALDSLLNQCQYQTLIHGDAKVANFCFSEGAQARDVAVVDFQYVGGGCGIRDVAYFFGSCLSDQDCHVHSATLLDDYFSMFREACRKRSEPLEDPAISKIEIEWRNLYAVAWADFHRFLSGWSPDHPKINSYAQLQRSRALAMLA